MQKLEYILSKGQLRRLLREATSIVVAIPIVFGHENEDADTLAARIDSVGILATSVERGHVWAELVRTAKPDSVSDWIGKVADPAVLYDTVALYRVEVYLVTLTPPGCKSVDPRPVWPLRVRVNGREWPKGEE